MKQRLLRGVLLVGVAIVTAACGQNPETTERARGVLTGANLVLALTIVFVLIAGALLFGAIALDRFVRSRQALEAAPSEEPVDEEEEEEVVAGIAVGRAGVPRWLYAFYVLIPVFAFLYVVNNVALRPAAEEKPDESAAPRGPVTEVTIVASGIKFNLDTITFPAETDVTVAFDNQDAGVPHDFTIWESEAAATANDQSAKIAGTNQITGVAETQLDFKTPGPGGYYFNCTVHPPSMFGTVEVVGVGGGPSA